MGLHHDIGRERGRVLVSGVLRVRDEGVSCVYNRFLGLLSKEYGF